MIADRSRPSLAQEREERDSDLIEGTEILDRRGRQKRERAIDTEAEAASPACLKPSPPRKDGGKRPGAGRKKDSPNKLTANVRACIMAAHAGDEDYLVKVAKTDPRTFCALLGMLLPTQVSLATAKRP
jgi:hypothetical protein